MIEEWRTPVSKGKIIDRRNRLIEYRNTREIRTIPLSRVIDENILDINYMIYEIERLNNIINKAIEYIEENSDDMHTYISQVLTDILKGSDKE